jgi:hypothetical protein
LRIQFNQLARIRGCTGPFAQLLVRLVADLAKSRILATLSEEGVRLVQCFAAIPRAKGHLCELDDPTPITRLALDLRAEARNRFALW